MVRRDGMQREAFRGLRRMAAPHGWRVVPDSEDWPVIPGRLGRIEWYDGDDLAVYTDHRTRFPLLRAIPGVRPWQMGDREMRALFPQEALAPVGACIQARRRRAPLSADALARLQLGRQKAARASLEARAGTNARS